MNVRHALALDVDSWYTYSYNSSIEHVFVRFVGSVQAVAAVGREPDRDSRRVRMRIREQHPVGPIRNAGSRVVRPAPGGNPWHRKHGGRRSAGQGRASRASSIESARRAHAPGRAEVRGASNRAPAGGGARCARAGYRVPDRDVPCSGMTGSATDRPLEAAVEWLMLAIGGVVVFTLMLLIGLVGIGSLDRVSGGPGEACSSRTVVEVRCGDGVG